MKKYKIGYTQGVFDMLHIGHLNLLNAAKERCEYLIVGINSDALVQSYKNKTPVIKAQERAEIVRNLKSVDECIIVDSLDKEQILKIKDFQVIFIGDDWKGNPRWEQTKINMQKYGVDVVFLKHTKGISSTQLRQEYESKVDG